MPKYIKCPRCELNWITEEQEYCDVCKAELKMGGITLLDDEEDEEERICPVCHINYLEDGEKICSECRDKKASKAAAVPFDTVPVASESEVEHISFDELEEEENWNGDDDDAYDDEDDFAADDFADELDDADLDDTDLEGDDFEEETEETPVADELEKDFEIDLGNIDEYDEDEEDPSDDDDL